MTDRFPHMKKVETFQEVGGAYFAPVSTAEKYARGVKSFLEAESARLFPKDEKKQDEWQQTAGSLLFKFQARGGILVQSTPYTNTAFAMFVPEHPLLDVKTYIEMRDYAVAQGKSKAVLGPIYTDLFMNMHGKPNRNEAEAKALLKSMAEHGIATNNARAPRLDQLVLVGDRDTGLLWVLRDGVQDKDVANTSDFVLKSYIGKNGLFRAFFYGDGYWQASGDDLAYSDNGGRVACYSAEGASLVTAPEVVARESVAEKQKADFLGRIQKGS